MVFKRGPPQEFVDAHNEVYDVKLGEWRKISEEEKEKLLRIARQCDQAYLRIKDKFWFLPIIRNFIAYRAAVKVHAEHNRKVFMSGLGIYAISLANGHNGHNGKNGHVKSKSELKKRDVAFRRLLREITEERLLVWKKVRQLEPAISILGSARIAENHFVYQQGQRIGEACAQREVPVRTGGGPSMMEAPFVGSLAQRLVRGLTRRRKIQNQAINIIFTDKEDPNPYGEISLNFNRFITRKWGLTENILGGIFVSGGYGTLDELFEFWRRGIPIVLFGSDFYDPIVTAFLRFVDANDNTRSISYRDKLFITDDPQEAVEFILRKAKEYPIERTSKKDYMDIIKSFKSSLYYLKDRPRSVVFQGRPKSEAILDFAARLMQMIAEDSNTSKQGIGIRVGSKGALYARLSEEAKLKGLHEAFEAVLFSPDSDIRLEADSLIFGRNIIRLRDESNQQLIAAYNSHAFVFFPGAVGTMNRLFDLLCVMQTNKISKRPIIVVDDNGSWREFFMLLREKMYTEWKQAGLDFAMISKEDIDFLQFVDVRDQDALEETMRAISRQVVLDNGHFIP
ncbi:MAG: LOG family protein [Candidatus Omnitrophica bacterium]|nr:LOG family protein [Candidatus Omnitrophota bacterium]MBU1997096.1 LOG family protein [Candidatus Omnitrophota bacterium]